jgi:glycosyltransferase involved in cell wall biosynthesis
LSDGTDSKAGAAGPAQPMPRVMFMTAWGDRPEVATAIGLARRGCDVHVCAMSNSPNLDTFRAAGLPVLTVPMRRRVDFATIRTVHDELQRGGFDILHLLHNRAISNGLIAARGLPHLKVIAYRGIVGNLSYLDPTAWLRHLNPRIDRIVCVADAVRDSMLEVGLFGLKLDPDKVVTIHKGHDLAWYDAQPVDLTRLEIPEGAFVIGCVANWRPRKGLEVLLRAFASMPDDLPIHLLLAGHMDSRRLAARVRRHRFADRIHNLGFRKDAPSLIAACDVSVLPTVKREGLPKTVIEAMAYGVAPVVTDCGGSPELVVDGESGLVVPPGDDEALAAALLGLYHDEKLRFRLGQAARLRIAGDFNVEQTIDRTLALYRSLVSSER